MFYICVNENMHDSCVWVSTGDDISSGWERIWSGPYSTKEKALASPEYKEAQRLYGTGVPHWKLCAK